MSVDVVDLREYYLTPLRIITRASLVAALERDGKIPDDIELVGIGYPIPLFDRIALEKPKSLILMPARQGALQWPAEKPSRVALVDEDQLPIETSSAECVIVLHLLENVSDPSQMLEEIWRILVPEGRLILIATNRRGLWTRFEHTPFGNGRPFSKSQLGRLLRKAKLTPTHWDDCLNFPPMRTRWLIRLYPFLDRIGHRLWPIFCGAHMVSATKRLYQGVPVKSKKSRRVAVPVLAPQGARTQNGFSTAGSNERVEEAKRAR